MQNQELTKQTTGLNFETHVDVLWITLNDIEGVRAKLWINIVYYLIVTGLCLQLVEGNHQPQMCFII